MGVGGGAMTVQSLTAAGDGGRQARPSARWGRVFVFTAAPNFVPNSAECFGWREGCLRVGALPATRCDSASNVCPTEREGGGSKQRDNEAASLATRSLLYTIHRAAEGLGLETCDEAAGTLHRGSCGAGAGARGGIVYNTGLWLERVRILHAICRTEQNSIWRGSSGN